MSQKFVEEHGGNIHKASKILNMKINDIIDFSANINPLGIPPALKETLISSIDTLVYYPDPEYHRLRSQLSDYTGVPSGRIIPGNGSLEIIFLLLKVLKPKNILIPAPSFSEYEKAAADFGINIRFFKLKEEESFRLNINRLRKEISVGVECILICNPNNPTSTLVSFEEMKLIIDLASRYKTTIIIDEAFIELTVGGACNSMANLVGKYDNLFIIRAFTKVFAVPGLRLGYGIGNEELVATMRSKQQPWSVNILAACAGNYLVDAEEYLQRTEAWLIEEKEWLYESMKAIPGLKPFKPDTNFILVKLCGTKNATELEESMAQRGILIRNASNFRFLDEHFFRVAVRDRASNRSLVEALKEEMKSKRLVFQ
ncbi:MAG: threonine-phosphate decarboxylase [Firmicutes bacterium]|nr:threonine-phosphate decarboxylase [Bacillota bacterium]